MRFDLFTPGVPTALILLALRVSGVLLVAPMFSSKTVPARVRTAFLLVVTLVLAPTAIAAVRAGGDGAALAALEVTPVAFLTESLVGLAIGLGAALLLAAVEMAGDLMTTTIGLSGASLLDPVNGQMTTVLTNLANLFALTVLLVLDGHLVMLDALGASLRAVPLGAGVDVGAGAKALVDAGGQLFVLGLRFAAPVLAAAMIGNVSLAVLSRVAPALNVLSVAFPIQIALGMVALLAALAFLATWMTGWASHLDGAIAPVVGALQPR